MSYNTELQNNNQELRGILEDVNNLPEAGSGGEGLAYTYDEYGKCYEVGRGDWEGAEELRIPSTYDDGVNGELPVKGLAYGAFQNMTMIKRVYADSLTYSRGSSFYGCSLDFLSIKGYKMTASFEFSSSGVKEVILGDVELIDWGTFIGCSPTCRFDFSECTQIPRLGSEDALGALTEGAQIVVPAALYDEWKNTEATNWVVYTDYIVAKGQENAQEKTIDITENGSYEVVPDEGKLLSKVGVNVNVGGGGDSASIDALIEGSITEISSNATKVCDYAFYKHEFLTSIDLPNATSISQRAFYACTALTSVKMPNVMSIEAMAFNGCWELPSVALPKVTSIGILAFSACLACLVYDFSGCTAVPTLADSNAFGSINADAKIKVPAALYDEWIAATNWTTYASYIVA